MAVLLASLLAASLAIGSGAIALAPSPSRLAARDPGALVGGNTVVATANGGKVIGVPHRPNFILALGSHETIVARGGTTDEIGARGRGDTIRAGSGHETIYGGPGGTIVGGSGSDQLIETHDNATVVVRGTGDEVVVSGRHDRVQCARGSRPAVIYRDASDAVSASCRGSRTRILPVTALHGARSAPAEVAQAGVTGAGTQADPFEAPCASASKHLCVVSSFPVRHLGLLWTNEHVPAYVCPDNYPWLYAQNYAPVGTTVPKGVEIEQDDTPWPIGVMILSAAKKPGSSLIDYLVGTSTGFPWSSATNWTPGNHWYKVILHCTDLANLAATG